MQQVPPHSRAETRSRPGITSLVSTGAGRLTLQTELVDHPAQLVTILVLRGRVLETWHSAFRVPDDFPDVPELVRRWHGELEGRVRDQLARVADSHDAQ